MQTPNRVLIIGLDGATWDVLDPWMRDGTLPNLARLRQQGSWGALHSSIPPITAAAWSTFMTGKRPGKHGVYHFVKLFDDDAPTASEPELVSARSLKSPALWDVIAHHDQHVVLVNIPLTYPPRPVNGVMITGLLTPSSAPVFTHPPELSARLAEYQIDLERFMDKTPHVDTFEPELTAPSLALVEEFRQMEERRATVSLELMESEPWDFFMVVFTSTDRMGHYLWPYHRSPQPDDPPDVQQLCQAVRDVYVRLDEIVGELVARAGEQTVTLVMSDHGMGPVETRRFHCNNWLHQRGWLAARASGTTLASPDHWLKRLGLSRDKIGRLIHRIPGLADSTLIRKAANRRTTAVDLERSQAYCVPIFYNIMGIRLRVPEPEQAALAQAIMGELLEITDPETGKRIVQRVFRGSDYYQGATGASIPDLIAILDPDYGCSYYLSSYSSVVTRRPVASGPAKHRSQGIFIAHGPGMRAQAEPLQGLQIEDVAPTTLHALGLPIPSDMDGRVIAGAFVAERLAAQPVRQGAPMEYWPSEHALAFGEEEMSAEDEAQIRDRLRALGYFE
ncbi:MAG TPA: alkaline phosphatase family protein [Herpetosiphonaceae bacterium]